MYARMPQFVPKLLILNCLFELQEDADSTPCVAVPTPDPSCDVPTSVAVDELACTMWTGEGVKECDYCYEVR